MNLKMIITIMIFLSVFTPYSLVSAEQILGSTSKFKKENPDGRKYEFTRDYLTSLEYLKKNSEQYELTRKASAEYKEEQRISALKTELIQNNVNLRVARNYLKKYHTQTNNGLMLNVSDIFTKVCDQLIELNNQEKILLDKMLAFHKGSAEKVNMSTVEADRVKIYQSRKDSLKDLLKASILVTKVLVSNQENQNGTFNRLGITQEQRYKLLEKLNHFSEETYRGELRSGQTFLEGSVVTIREILEDYNYQSNDG
ncbi:MAG: hypothetical protein KBD53_02135 [Candidatus Omnitrophica bacterium]|nr:hypothetical protein [Candidatus Omnitrophota bacterium]